MYHVRALFALARRHGWLAAGSRPRRFRPQLPFLPRGHGTKGGADQDKKKLAGNFPEVHFLDLNIVLLAPEEDKKTGFVVAGKNATSLIRGLKQINGRTIKALEDDMRPGQMSAAGFLGKNEKLLDVLAKDNEYVVDQLGMWHQELWDLYALEAIFRKLKGQIDSKEPVRCTYSGRRYEIWVTASRQGLGIGGQPSPFKDGTGTNALVKVHNLDNGQKLEYSALVAIMVERYGFLRRQGHALPGGTETDR